MQFYTHTSAALRPRAIFSRGALTVAICTAIAAGAPAQIVEQWGLVAAGPEGDVVNEPAIAHVKVQVANAIPPDTHRFLVVYQTQDEPTQQNFEIHKSLHYAIGTMEPPEEGRDPVLTWEEPEEPDLPFPGECSFQRYDPTAVTREGSPDHGFLAAGTGLCLVEFVLRHELFTISSGEDTHFDDGIDIPQRLGGCQVRHPRLGSPPESGVPDRMFLLGQLLTGDCGDQPFQIALNTSQDGGDTWQGWAPLTDGSGQAVLGIPSRPDIDPDPMREDLAYFSYSHTDFQSGATIINAGNADFETGAFTDLELNLVPEMVVGLNEGYFNATNRYLPGDFGIMPTTATQIYYQGCPGCPDDPPVYVVYHDLADDTGQQDGDFNIYMVKGTWNGSGYTWSNRVKVNQDNGGVQSEQFMPVFIISHASGCPKVMYVAYYDTRDDPQGPDDPVNIGLYFAQVSDDYEDCEDTEIDLVVQETRIDIDDAIRTPHLRNPQFIGDFMDMVLFDPATDSLLLVATGTQHPRNLPPGFGSSGGPTVPQDDEGIYFWWIGP